MTGYVLCTTGRSGSNFLCQLLESTGKLGVPREYFNGPGRRALDDPSFPDAPADQIERILRDGATSNGIFALKAFPDQWRAAAAHVPLTIALPDLKFVRLARRDILSQAISWAIAVQTKQYRASQEAVATPHYDGKMIFALLQTLALFEADWSVFFARTQLPVLELAYEDVERGPQDAVDKVAAWMNITDAEIVWDRVSVRVQRTERNQEWRARFLAEHGAPDAFYPPTFRPIATT